MNIINRKETLTTDKLIYELIHRFYKTIREADSSCLRGAPCELCEYHKCKSITESLGIKWFTASCGVNAFFYNLSTRYHVDMEAFRESFDNYGPDCVCCNTKCDDCFIYREYGRTDYCKNIYSCVVSYRRYYNEYN